ncbi:pilus assembly protein [Neptuniibacter caesariensis]|uniref:Tfp pilus assembly protein tip-associated adhesin n=1 Tax=Neptuniibacter caesariensis TaxID=207954 RepID=A0A7U8C689_NEPCE|nr:PilC/PilY family type IV pilus protein [Neptuniibacter caesariensis]EAR61471.1 Tfp pilus assembly protein tip-associated adhesin [Oceanospirillum sp. MED92] [Neptuniibacter caesariensis]
MFKKVLLTFITVIYTFIPLQSHATTIAQDPLYLVVGADPNVLFNMSIETPMGGAAYNDQPGTLAGGNTCAGRTSGYGACYFKDETYLGYFDPKKCYTYNSGGGYFEPDGATNNDHECSGKFSGNMMNWATMTAMDMFVYTLTGGNRVIDNTGSNAVTVVKRAKRQNNDGWFPRKVIYNPWNVSPSTVSPFSQSYFYIRNYGKGESGNPNSSTESVRFCTTADCSSGILGSYKVHVRVCDKTEGVESNCVSYSSGSYYKPEGLVQSKMDDMRFAVTSYLKDNSNTRDGGVLRSNMKYVGPTMPNGSGGTQTNSNAEVNADGTYVNDPDGLAGSGGVDYSGVINYINRFSEYGYKGLDPAAELFYESLRYFKNLGPTPEYSSGLTNTMKGGFPVLTSWNDPIQYSCQKNFIIGINDANPWLDKSLPGTHFTSSTFNGRDISEDYGEPSNPDTDINVTTLTNTVGSLEGLNGTSQCVGCTAGNCNMSSTNKTIPALGEVLGTCPYPPKENSYYIAGLAYYANTQDIRTDAGMDGEQNVATFMIDTQEYSSSPLTGQMNMLWLAGKYGGFLDSNGNDQPDLTSEWDSDGDGEPDNYVLATRPDKMIAALSSSFDEIEARTSSASAVATNSTRLDTNSKIYQARFSSGTWTGSLLAYDINAITGAVESLAWDAADLIPSESNRNIFSYNDSSNAGVIFEHTNLSTAQKALITSDQLDYIRGDQSNEGATFRSRSKVLGDIINSDPIYTSNDNFNYYVLETVSGNATYDDYLIGTTETWQKGNRQDMLYVGGNDGMLHALRGTGVSTAGCNPNSQDCEGEEVFAYVPKSLISDLPNLASLSYQHQYFVDGSPRFGDAYIDFDGSGDRWGTALVGTLAGGGKGIFALDISDPLNFAAGDVLWDLDSSDLSDLGYTFAQPTIAKLANGDWGVIVGNGYNSANHEAVLYILNLETGAVIAKLETDVTGNASATNGLSTPIAVDTDGDKVADTVYAGDLKGNMWKFDISDSNTSKWEVAYKDGNGNNAPPAPLFKACTDNACTDPQPITSKPQVIRATNGDLVVLFGTGKYFETGDNTDTSQIQTFYGIQDDGTQVANRSTLVNQDILAEFTALQTGLNYDTRLTTDYGVDYGLKDGWLLDFDSSTYLGERVVANPLVRNGRVIFPTLVPDTGACSYGGTSWLMELDAETGSRLTISPFDLNDDGSINSGDYVRYDSDGDGDIDSDDELIPVSGKKSTVGIIKTPGVISTGDDELKYTSGSSGNIEVTAESSGDKLGRQSWIQIK